MQALQIESPSPIASPAPTKTLNQEFVFFIHGIASIIGWFVVINSLDYFHSVYTQYDVYSYFLLSLLLGYLITIAAFRSITAKIAIPKLINFGLLLSGVSLLSLLAISLPFRNYQPFGFTLSIMACLMVGISGNIVQLSYFTMINFVAEKVISRFTIGTAVSGLSLTIIRMLILAVSGSKIKSLLQILIYFAIAMGLLIFDLSLNTLFCKSDYYRTKIAHQITAKSAALEILNEPKDSQQPQSNLIVKKTYLQTMLQTYKAIFPYPLIIFCNFVVTMMLFPELMVKITFGFSRVWSGLTFIFLFGLGDTLGKFLIEVKGSFNKTSNLYLVLSRTVYLFWIPLLASGKAHNDPLVYNYFFPFLICFLFGVTNGFVVSSSFILTKQKCPPEYKQHAGVLCGIALQLGLTFGTIIGIPMQLIANSE